MREPEGPAEEEDAPLALVTSLALVASLAAPLAELELALEERLRAAAWLLVLLHALLLPLRGGAARSGCERQGDKVVLKARTHDDATPVVVPFPAFINCTHHIVSLLNNSIDSASRASARAACVRISRSPSWLLAKTTRVTFP